MAQQAAGLFSPLCGISGVVSYRPGHEKILCLVHGLALRPSLHDTAIQIWSVPGNPGDNVGIKQAKELKHVNARRLRQHPEDND